MDKRQDVGREDLRNVGFARGSRRRAAHEARESRRRRSLPTAGLPSRL
jgi:hypothetical protein